MILHEEINSFNICLSVSIQTLENILKHDEFANYGKEVCFLLEEIEGVSDTNYNGHFGAYIYCKIDSEYYNKKTIKKINNVLKEIK